MATPSLSSSNSVLEVIGARRSVRQFTEQEVSDADLMALLNAANRAPSAHNQQSWHFIILRGQKKQALADLINRRLDRFPRTASVLLRLAARTIVNAPVVVAVVNTGELIEHGSKLFQIEGASGHDFFRTMEIQSSAAAVENLMLAATSLGLASVWFGILYLLKDEVLALLGEAQGEFMAVIPVGYPVRTTRGPAKRSVEELIRVLE